MTNLPALHEAVERRRRCGCEKCEGCGSDRDALVNAAPALLDEVEALRAGTIPADWLAMHAADKGMNDALRADLMGQRDANDTLLAHANALERDNATLRDDLAAARAMRDTWQTRYTVNAEHLKHVEDDLAAARAVLDDADVEYDDPDIDAVTIIVDRAAWLAWQERQR